MHVLGASTAWWTSQAMKERESEYGVEWSGVEWIGSGRVGQDCIGLLEIIITTSRRERERIETQANAQQQTHEIGSVDAAARVAAAVVVGDGDWTY
jgi:hypothetical protein